MKFAGLLLLLVALTGHANQEDDLRAFDQQIQADIDNAEQLDSAPAILANAYFFALEHQNFEGAYAQYSQGMKERTGSEAAWEKSIKQNFPMLWLHAGREITEVLQSETGAVVFVQIEDIRGDLYSVALTMRIIDGEWRIVAGTISRIELENA